MVILNYLEGYFYTRRNNALWVFCHLRIGYALCNRFGYRGLVTRFK